METPDASPWPWNWLPAGPGLPHPVRPDPRLLSSGRSFFLGPPRAAGMGGWRAAPLCRATPGEMCSGCFRLLGSRWSIVCQVEETEGGKDAGREGEVDQERLFGFVSSPTGSLGKCHRCWGWPGSGPDSSWLPVLPVAPATVLKPPMCLLCFP